MKLPVYLSSINDDPPQYCKIYQEGEFIKTKVLKRKYKTSSVEDGVNEWVERDSTNKKDPKDVCSTIKQQIKEGRIRIITEEEAVLIDGLDKIK